MLPAKRTWSVAQASGSDSHNLPVLSLDSFGIVASFVGRTELRAMSCANRGAFDLLQEHRAKRRAEWDDSRGGMINPNFANASARMRYYNCIESFTYQFLLGQLVLETKGCDFAEAILHGPVLEHLLTLCGANLQLARNVVANYTYLYNATSLLDDNDPQDPYGWLADRPDLRMDDSELTMRGKMDDNGLYTWFDSYFAKDDFPGLDAYAYVWYLIRESDEVFKMIQCTLSLRMRAEDGKCELEACGTLLDDMHMTTTVLDFVTHLQTIHVASVQQRIAAREDEEAPCPVEIADALPWYDDITPSGIYLQNDGPEWHLRAG
jgi:hypothetical protein